jgi:hydroxyacylglutathione hydrolase
MKRVNKEGPALLQALPSPQHLPATRLPELLVSGAQVVDTRQAGAYARQFLPGSINIPADELSSWAGWLVDYDRPLYLVVDRADVARAVRDLIYIGVDNVAGYFETHAVATLAELGHPLHSYEVATVEKIAGPVQRGDVVVVDVRNETEWAEGHLPESKHIMLGYLAQRAGEVVDHRPVVVLCRTGNRSAIGASILLAQGAKEVMNLQGGIRDWEAAGLPVVREKGEKQPA